MRRKRTRDQYPVQRFPGWLKGLATVDRNRIQPKVKFIPVFEVVTRPTPHQSAPST